MKTHNPYHIAVNLYDMRITPAQNRMYRGLIRRFSEKTRQSVDRVHEEIKREVLEPEFNITTTTKLSPAGCEVFIEQVVAWAAKQGVILELPVRRVTS